MVTLKIFTFSLFCVLIIGALAYFIFIISNPTARAMAYLKREAAQDGTPIDFSAYPVRTVLREDGETLVTLAAPMVYLPPGAAVYRNISVRMKGFLKNNWSTSKTIEKNTDESDNRWGEYYMESNEATAAFAFIDNAFRQSGKTNLMDITDGLFALKERYESITVMDAGETYKVTLRSEGGPTWMTVDKTTGAIEYGPIY